MDEGTSTISAHPVPSCLTVHQDALIHISQGFMSAFPTQAGELGSAKATRTTTPQQTSSGLRLTQIYYSSGMGGDPHHHKEVHCIDKLAVFRLTFQGERQTPDVEKSSLYLSNDGKRGIRGLAYLSRHQRPDEDLCAPPRNLPKNTHFLADAYISSKPTNAGVPWESVGTVKNKLKDFSPREGSH